MEKSLIFLKQSTLHFVMGRRNIEAILCPQGQNSKIHRSLPRGIGILKNCHLLVDWD
jgi:hypothetical protein